MYMGAYWLDTAAMFGLGSYKYGKDKIQAMSTQNKLGCWKL